MPVPLEAKYFIAEPILWTVLAVQDLPSVEVTMDDRPDPAMKVVPTDTTPAFIAALLEYQVIPSDEIADIALE